MAGETWFDSAEPPVPQRLGFRAWVRILRRGVPFGLLVSLGLLSTLALRPLERLRYGAARPWTAWITVYVCRLSLAAIGLRHLAVGLAQTDASILVANHSSWLDIFVLNAQQPLYFVSKSEVAGWPGIGWLARATGTLFIARKRNAAKDHVVSLQKRVVLGHRLLFFPEGTSSDSLRVLPFKSTLFAAFFDLQEPPVIQPITLRYHAPAGADPRIYGWWGDMDFGPHLLQVLAVPRQGEVTANFHPVRQVAEFKDRKALASALEITVRAGFG